MDKSSHTIEVKKEDIDRVSLWIVGILGFIVVFGGIIQMREHLHGTENNVFKPIQEKYANAISPTDSSLASTAAGQEFVDQQNTDTDEDGLSDFDELNIHGTSPYIADSDSDGISDSDELLANTDPNCAEGAICGTSLGSGVATSAADQFSEFDLEDQNTLNAINVTNQELARVSALSVQEKRAFLINETAYTQQEVDQLSDDDINTIFEISVTEIQDALGQTADQVVNQEE